MVCDKTLLLKDQELFEHLIETRWNVVVPHQGVFQSLSLLHGSILLTTHLVFADLSTLSKTMAPESDAAHQALRSVQSAYTQQSKIRILTASGEDITKRHLASERPKTPVCSSPVDPTTSSEDIQDDLIGVTRRATDLNSYEKPSDATEETRSAILLTDDRLTRVRAKTGMVASLAPSMLRRILSTARSRMRSVSQVSGNSDHIEDGKPDPNVMDIAS